MAKNKLCGATLEHENGETWECVLEVDPEVETAPHYGPFHFDDVTPGQSRGWVDADLPAQPIPS